MTTYSINLASLLPHGLVDAKFDEGMLKMTVTHALPYAHCKPGLANRHYMALRERYSLPLRIDMTAKIDAPAIHLEIGKGFLSFGTHRQDNRLMDDICEPKLKTKNFDNHIAMNEFNDLSVLFGYKEMQILINNEERYYSNNEPYMKSRLLPEMNAEGFAIRISCDKNVRLVIFSMNVTEYIGIAPIRRPFKYEIISADGTHPVAADADGSHPVAADADGTHPTATDAVIIGAHPNVNIGDGGNRPAMSATSAIGATSGANAGAGAKPTFEKCIANLPRELSDAATSLDNWLRTLQPLKFKRTIEKFGNKITYIASNYGFSYAMYPDGDVLYHQLQWYIITNKKPELWGRKDDHMEDVLNRLAEEDAEFARRMFGNLHECVNGRPAGCLAKTKYTHAGLSKITCHGTMRFKMSLSDFADVRRFIGMFNEMIIGDKEMEKINETIEV